jgi:hypothetical protein
MGNRLRHWLHALAVALDQLAYVILAGPKYLIVGGEEPDAHETISSRVGRSAIAGKAWALVAEWIIDRLFQALGSAPGHCRRAIVPGCRD